MPTCSNCQASVIAAAKFCGDCGASLHETSPAVKAEAGPGKKEMSPLTTALIFYSIMGLLILGFYLYFQM